MKPVGIAVLAGGAGLAVGLTVGFGLGVLSNKAGREAFERLVTVEEKADVAHPQRLEKPGFTVSYPGNWKLKPPTGKDDPDHVVTFESAGGDASVVLIVLDAPTDAKDNVERQREQLTKKVMTDATSKPFGNWGRYHGEGLELDGKLLGLAPGVARIFSASEPKRSFIAVEVSGDSAFKADLASGFHLLERTFELRAQP